MSVLAYDDYSARHELSADVVVIGTGSGGAAAGAELATSGTEVLFVEEGSYHPTSSFNPYFTETLPRLYRDAGATVIMGRPPIPYVEGRCVGGSTVINGGMAWRTPERVLAEWERITGQPELGPRGMEPLFEEVEERLHAKPQHPVSIGEDNRIMEQGARKLGWEYKPNLRSQNLCVGTNQCGFGCPTGAKQSTLVSYMPRAFEAGARCATDVRVRELWIEGGRCVGVKGRAVNPRTRDADKDVLVRAKAVVVACGAVQTPYLLLRHKLGRRSRQLGKNFLCHPNAKVLAVYPFEVRGWQGVSQGGQIREWHEDGIVLAENMVPPATAATQIPFIGAEAMEFMKDYNRMAMTGVLVEDSRAGTVRRSPFGVPYAKYNITAYDHQRFIEGARRLATLHFEMGATLVTLPFSNFHVAHSVDELERAIRMQRSVSTLELFTVHLMGTCRMGAREERSVVDLNGQVWDLPGCYVADASLFPTAIGVNPQITISALATRVARRLKLAN